MESVGGVQVGGKGWGRLLRVRVPKPAAAAVDVHNAVDFAAALHTLVEGWTRFKNIITVDAEVECVSYQQGDTQRRVQQHILRHLRCSAPAARATSSSKS
jgi:hypothetical protein